jgi:hypothetical protein
VNRDFFLVFEIKEISLLLNFLHFWGTYNGQGVLEICLRNKLKEKVLKKI